MHLGKSGTRRKFDMVLDRDLKSTSFASFKIICVNFNNCIVLGGTYFAKPEHWHMASFANFISIDLP